jgi:hypothetical protein
MMMCWNSWGHHGLHGKTSGVLHTEERFIEKHWNTIGWIMLAPISTQLPIDILGHPSRMADSLPKQIWCLIRSEDLHQNQHRKPRIDQAKLMFMPTKHSIVHNAASVCSISEGYPYKQENPMRGILLVSTKP